MRKLYKIFIITLFSTSIIYCQQPNNTTFEEIAVKYFADSIMKLVPKTKYMSFCYDGKVKTVSRYYDNPVLLINTPEYKESLEFEKSYLNNNDKDFEIPVPDKIKKMKWEEFQQFYNLNEYFLNVKLHIKSSKKILVQIDVYANYIKEDPLFMKFYFFINPINLRVIDHLYFGPMNPFPPYRYINHETSFFGKIIDIDGYKKNQPNGYTSVTLQKTYMKFWIKESKNISYEPNELKYFLKRNDSIVKYHKNDTLFVYRKNKIYHFVLGKTINKKE